jgi:hypothetical protein
MPLLSCRCFLVSLYYVSRGTCAGSEPTQNLLTDITGRRTGFIDNQGRALEISETRSVPPTFVR